MDGGRRAFWTALHSRLNVSNIPTLDGLRAVAVTLVVLYHCEVPYAAGPLGVEMFFVLSGFLITWLLLREHAGTGRISLSSFYVRRALRIFPAFYVFFALAVGIELYRGRPVHIAEAASVFSYVGNYYVAIFHPNDGGFLPQTWSLAIEEQFYILWPTVYVLLARRRDRLSLWLMAIVGLEWVYRAALHLAGASDGYIYHAFDARLDHLMVGCLLAVVLCEGRWSGLWQAACRWTWQPFATATLLAASAFGDSRSAAYRNLVGFAVEPVLVALLIVQLVMLHRSAAWGWLQWRSVRFVGRISYSLYLYQQLMVPVPDRWFGTEPSAAKTAAGVALTAACATLSYFVIEQPFMRLKQRLHSDRAVASGVPRPAQAPVPA